MDAGVVNIASPVSGCVLSATEVVTIWIFNYGDTIHVPPTSYNVTYVITGPIPATVTEVVSFPANSDTILPSSTYTYSFATTADFSATGTYTIDAYITLPGDVNNTNDTLSGYQVISDTLSVGGTVSGSTTVCEGSNGGTVTLSGNSGDTIRWEYSTDGGLTWVHITNTSSSQSFADLPNTTMYRAVIQNGVCPVAFSAPATITVDPESVGGFVNDNEIVCSGSNSGTLTLSSYVGSILNWEYSTDGGFTWLSIVNVAPTQSYLNLTTTTWYRAKVQNGVCPPAESFIAVITVDSQSVGGTVSGSDTVCSDSNYDTLKLSGWTGDVLNWEFSIDGGSSWIGILNTDSIQIYSNLTVTTMFRAIVQNELCDPDPSAAVTITVNSMSVGGTVSSDSTVCYNSDGSTLILSSYTGNILNWDSSVDTGVTWTTIINSTDTLSYSNLTTTTWYRAMVKSGICSSDTSSVAVITVDPLPVGGTVSSSTTVCSGSNSGSLTLGGHTGDILRWEYSIDSGGTWVNTTNTTLTQTYSNLTTTTMYRVVIESGICLLAFSGAATITVDPVATAGTIEDDRVCAGSNGDTLKLNGYAGNILNWDFSTDGGATWTNIVNTSDTLSYNNLVNTTWYRAIVESGVCPNDTSVAVINVDPATVGGTVFSDVTICGSTNYDTLTLSGHTGDVLRWEYTTDSGFTWVYSANIDTIKIYSNLTVTTMFRAVVQSGTCTSENSIPVTVTVNPMAVGGTLSSDEVCTGSNGDTLKLNDYAGNILNWNFSTDGGATWTNIANTSDTLSYNNLINTTWYRAIVESGSCPNDTSSIAVISVDPITVGGIVSGDTTLCGSSNYDTLKLSGHIGDVLNWEYSTDSGFTWVYIANIDTIKIYSNLTVTTMFRAVVQSGTCTSANSTPVTVAANPMAVGGTLSSDEVCTGSNGDTLKLNGYAGNILNWDFSTDGGATWTNIANTSDTLSYNNLVNTTWYRAIVESGVCPNDTSSIAVISVDPITVGGIVSGDTTVCSGSNFDTLKLSGHIGDVLNWEYSTDSGFIWIAISNTDTFQLYNNLTTTTMFRASVQSGVCSSSYSSTAIISVDPVPIGGTVGDDATVCGGSNGGALTLNGYTGSVSSWAFSIDTGTSWTTIANTTDTLSYYNLTNTTWYRTIIEGGVCPNDTSSIVVISVDPITVGGVVSGNTTICSGSNYDTLKLSGHVGDILNWEYSIDSGFTWINISNTDTIQIYSNLTTTTLYRALVQNGVCPSAYSSASATITIEMSVGGTVGDDALVCSGSNYDTLTLSGHTGNVLNWEYSIDGGNIWITIADTNTTLVYINLTTPTMYRAVVQNGICTPAYSSAANVVIAQAVGGVVGNDANVCGGSNGGTLKVNGYTGNILNWLYSTDSGTTWINIPDTTDTLSYNNLTTTTWYRAIVKFGVCNPDTSSIAVISVYSKPIAGFSASTVCWGDPTIFTNLSTISSGTITAYNWDFGDGGVGSSTLDNPKYTYSYPGTFSVELIVKTASDCYDTVIANAIVNPLPTANITPNGPAEFCAGSNVILSVASGFIYSWNTGDTTQGITVVSSDTYTVEVADANGCVNSDSVTVAFFPLPVSVAGNDTTISLGYSVDLNGQGGGNYSWSPSFGLDNPSIADPVATPLETTTYILTVTDANGCVDTSAITVTVIVDYTLIISNVLTPNGDGKNDTWFIDNIENYSDCEVTILNRYGKVIFEAANYQNDWDGNYNGKKLPDGTYYYLLKFPGAENVLTGAVTIFSEN